MVRSPEKSCLNDLSLDRSVYPEACISGTGNRGTDFALSIYWTNRL